MKTEQLKLPASGTYHYYLNDTPAGVVETWRIWRENDALCTESRREAVAYQTTLSVATVSASDWLASDFARWEIHLQQHTPDAADVRAVYEFGTDHQLQVTRHVNGTLTDKTALTLPVNCLGAPLMRIFLGPTILRVATCEEAGAQVLVPDLMHLADPQRVLQPTFDLRRAEFLNKEKLEVAGCEYATARYAYQGQHYDDQAEFWLDARGLLVRYAFRHANGQHWRADLMMNDE